MPTPAKPVNVLVAEGRSHRTKAELELRRRGEKSLLTGISIKEEKPVKANPVAHSEFLRMKKLLGKIEKNDDLYGAAINRYCKLRAEEIELMNQQEKLKEKIDYVSDRLFSGGLDDAGFRDVSRSLADLEKTYVSLDKQIQSKRKMQSEIERENVMTISAALRSIPKKPEDSIDPVKEALYG